MHGSSIFNRNILLKCVFAIFINKKRYNNNPETALKTNFKIIYSLQDMKNLKPFTSNIVPANAQTIAATNKRYRFGIPGLNFSIKFI